MAKEKVFYNAVNIVLQAQYKELKKLREKHGSWQKAWEEISTTKEIKIDPQEEFKKLESLGITLILLEETSYPPLLKEIPFPPFGIYVKGVLPKNGVTIGIVGTRKATSEGKELAREFGKELSASGCIIVSGLALGIDSMGHRGTLEAKGITVAVLANGLDHIYPSTNTNLGEEIIRQNGALISEYPLGSPSLPYRFLERNRIISGLSKGVVIIEAPHRSGTIATARFALESNRDIFVIPGPARHPNFAGSHELIKQGASLVTTPTDVLVALDIAPKPKKEIADLTAEETIIMDILQNSTEALLIDKIIEMSHLQPPVVNQLISLLLIKGLVQETDSGYTTIIEK